MELPIQAQNLKKYLESSFYDIRKKYNLTMNEILLLIYLLKNKNQNTARDVVDKINITKSHVSKSVESLVSKGIITRYQDKEDKKIIHLEILNKDSDIIKDIEQNNIEINIKILEGIPEEDIEVFKKCLKLIIENIYKMLKE